MQDKVAGGHPLGKPGKFWEFESDQGQVRKNGNNKSGKVYLCLWCVTMCNVMESILID